MPDFQMLRPRQIRQKGTPWGRIKRCQQVHLHLAITTPGTAEAAAQHKHPARPKCCQHKGEDDDHFSEKPAALGAIKPARQEIRAPKRGHHGQQIGVDERGCDQKRCPGYPAVFIRPRQAKPKPHQQQEMLRKPDMPSHARQPGWLQHKTPHAGPQQLTEEEAKEDDDGKKKKEKRDAKSDSVGGACGRTSASTFHS